MTKKLISIAAIKAPHGVKGLVSIRPHSGDVSSLTDYGPLTDKTGTKEYTLIPHFEKKGAMVCGIEGITDRTAVERLVGKELYIDRAVLPDTEDDDEFYYSDLEGLEIRSPKGDIIGHVVRVQNFGAGELLDVVITSSQDKQESHFIPFNKECVPEVNVTDGYITITPPRGLLSQDKPKK
jgi:16S rRNA processing protein RimM